MKQTGKVNREEEMFYKERQFVHVEKSSRVTVSLVYVSEEKVELCEGGGETAGEEREASASATGDQGEESSGTISILFTPFLPN